MADDEFGIFLLHGIWSILAVKHDVTVTSRVEKIGGHSSVSQTLWFSW